MINIVLQIRPVLGGADCAGMVALNHRNSQFLLCSFILCHYSKQERRKNDPDRFLIKSAW